MTPARFAAAAVLAVLAVWTPRATGAAEGRLYPSGPPNGVAYLRFVNMAPQEVTIVSPAAKITIPADDAHRVRAFDPVTPGVALTGSAQLGKASAAIDVKLAANEFVTVAVSADGPDGMKLTVFREVPADFNAQKSSLGLFNLDKDCGQAQLVAGDNRQSVIPDVAPGGVGRRSVNPVNVELAVACADPAKAAPARLGQLTAGDRYSIFVVDAGGAPQIVAQRDEQAPFRP
ncbi:MAG: alginate O-acetyltransferase AlgF [Alphaproteobacteria bacterium]|nr:alginate O-acetyltransferase AlgF [Alphaproteobacteria bacterium]